jgi:hypothetical protein
LQRRQEEFDKRRRLEANLRLEARKSPPSHRKRAKYTDICCHCEQTTKDVADKYVVVCEAACHNEIHQRCLDPSLRFPAEQLEAWYCPNCVTKETGAGAAAAAAAGATHTGNTTTSTDATHAPSTPSSHASRRGREMEMEMEREGNGDEYLNKTNER